MGSRERAVNGCLRRPYACGSSGSGWGRPTKRAYVTCHVRYMSPVTCHPLHATRSMPPVPCHLLRAPRFTPPVTSHVAHTLTITIPMPPRHHHVCTSSYRGHLRNLPGRHGAPARVAVAAPPPPRSLARGGPTRVA